MSVARTAHIRLDDGGVAWIDDTNVKVIEVVLDKLAHGSSPEEMHFQYPHLSLAQIGEHFGGRDHTTVLHAQRKITGEVDHGGQIQRDIENLKRVLRAA